MRSIEQVNTWQKWQVASGKWQVASGKWQVTSGKWQVASGKWQVTSDQGDLERPQRRAKLRRRLLAAGVGIGGGRILVPIYILLLEFPVKHAIPLASTTVLVFP